MILSPRAEVAGSSPLTRGKRCVGRGRTRRCRLIPAHAGKTSAISRVACADRAHPRSRGENTWLLPRGQRARGSSPLTRGKLRVQQGVDAAVRLIPAHAGKTRQGRESVGNPKAHPRSRGENTVSARSPALATGSSPLTRGKPPWCRPGPRGRGLIPAHAGKTSAGRSRPGPPWAHPRSRGENRGPADPRRPGGGSSPLTRGKQQRRYVFKRLERLIPAHAGKTQCPWLRQSRVGAHPRSRGENAPGETYEGAVTGSSPLTRGKQGTRCARHVSPGLIPAHAGKTLATPRNAQRQPAHPRSRGENRNVVGAVFARLGSSPLTRGKLEIPVQLVVGCGLIPAHAGKTSDRRLRIPMRRAHPRSRGENSLVRLTTLRAAGSSPLTRGKRHVRQVARGLGGLIPAHAGKTDR